ncbi:MAG: CpsD/CapB family tyrosine-protein kinase [Oscillospiraceae bacterium]|nr:CpsD/CapB family tyrosine-protein kinase [Oscillospiraceae bacterium]
MNIRTNKKKRQVSGADDYLLTESSPFSVQEAYKALRTNVLFSLPGGKAKCIGVTSSMQSEGKSMNTVNLALSFGQIGKRVLLVDCDMRLPTVATKLGLVGQPGLSDVLVGNSALEEAVQDSEQFGISVLPAGTIPPDPTRLLESEQMQELLSRLREEYDYVLIDLPPITTVADASILAKYLDGFLLVVKHGQSQYRAIRSMMTQLQLANANVLGFIYANASIGGSKYYKSYYSYGSYGK